MKNLINVSFLFALFGCGYSAIDSEFIGQIKYVEHATPIICPDYYYASVSMGVMKNGVGSMSTHDATIEIDKTQVEEWKRLSKNASIVKINYNERRATLCVPLLISTGVTEVK